MAQTARRFEDLVAWQKARVLTSAVYSATRVAPFDRDFGLAGQIQRSSVSIMANIAEGFDRKRPREFHQYLSVSKASCAEVRSHLYVAFDIGYLTQAQFDELMSMAVEAGKVIGGLRSAVERGIRPADSVAGGMDSELRTQNSEPW
jgi:four helix bundle protein